VKQFVVVDENELILVEASGRCRVAGAREHIAHVGDLRHTLGQLLLLLMMLLRRAAWSSQHDRKPADCFRVVVRHLKRRIKSLTRRRRIAGGNILLQHG